MDHSEIEWQFDADDLGAVAGWLHERPDLAKGPVLGLTDAYHDTEDWRLHRAGYALRVRRGTGKAGKKAEATMKSFSVPGEDGLKRRREISEPIRSGSQEALRKADGPVGERVRLLAGNRDLRRLFQIRTHRTTFFLLPEGSEHAAPNGETNGETGSSGDVVVDAAGDIRTEDGSAGLSAGEVVVDAAGGIRRAPGPEDEALAEVALDETEIRSGRRKPARLTRIEVEMLPTAPEGSEEIVRAFVGEMRSALDLRPAGASKFGTGLSAARLSPPGPPDFGPTEITGEETAGKAAYAVLRRHFQKMLAHEPGTRLGEDPEELHDMRVATRRMRATLKLYARYLPMRAARFEGELKHFAAVLGAVRDLDVHLEHLDQLSHQEGGDGLSEVAAVLRRRREGARERLLKELDSARYGRFVREFAASLRRGRTAGGEAGSEPALSAAAELVWGRYRKVRRKARRLDGSSPVEEWHDLRKKAKRLRYALEPFVPLYGKPAKRAVEGLKDFQDDLGAHQDLVVFEELLREVALSEDLPPRTVFAMGALAGQNARAAARLRGEMPGRKSFRALNKGGDWKKLRDEMEGRAARARKKALRAAKAAEARQAEAREARQAQKVGG